MLKFTQVSLAKKLALSVMLCFVSFSCYADVSVVVHPGSNIESLTTKQIRKLFLGRLRMLPNTDRDVVVVDQGVDSLPHKYMYSELVSMTPDNLKRYRAAYLFGGKGRLPITLKGDDQVKDFVAGSLYAIGYIDAASVDDSVKSVYLLSID